jgi:hypothetical protein
VRIAMRFFVVLLAAAVVLPVPALAADAWEELRNRPGNDDIFVMVDTSLSMSPSLGGSLVSVKRFLQDLLVRYAKDGDRIIIMTFDSEAHVRGIVPIVERRRDTELLRDVIDGIDARRVIHYDGTYPNLAEVGDGRLTGGGAWTDYCDMWRLSSRVIEKYSEPRHRQLFLLFTDGRPDAPPYRPCNDPGVLSTFSAGLREDRFRMGVVALPTGTSSAEELSGRLSELLQRMPGYEEIRKNTLRVIGFNDSGHRIDGIRREILELISSRVDLLDPPQLALNRHYKINLDTTVTIVNKSRVPRTLALRGAILSLRESQQPIAISVAPAVITLLPGQRGVLTLTKHDFLQQPGEYRGLLAFNFGTASRFDPAVLEFSVTKLTWWQAFGHYVTWAVAALAALLIVILLWVTYVNTFTYAPAKITGHYRGDPYSKPDRYVDVGAKASFGGGGRVPGELFVNAIAPSGTLLRVGANDWKLSWDGMSYDNYLSGLPIAPPGSGDDDAWLFFIDTNRRRTLKGIPAWLRSKLGRTRDA